MRENLEVRAEILGYLAQRAARGEGPPSVKEVGEAVSLRSTQTTHKHLKKLEEAGYVERGGAARQARGLRLTRKGWEAIGRTPLLGRIAAGRGLEAIPDEDAAFSLPAELFASSTGRDALRVVGQSMTGAGIEDGDLIVVEEDEDPPDGA